MGVTQRARRPLAESWLRLSVIVGSAVVTLVVVASAAQIGGIRLATCALVGVAALWCAQRTMRRRETDALHRTTAGLRAERDSLREINDELRHRATHDRLMGIPNRELLRHELEAALVSQQAAHVCGTPHGGVGLLFLDLDRFKFVNDSLGHQAGDALLVMVGERIKSALADEDNALVARVGGDEIVVLMRCLQSNDHLGLVADKLLATFVDPFTIDGVELGIGSSIGMAASIVGECADDLYRHADAALYDAKQRGRGRAVMADAGLRSRRAHELNADRALRDALTHNEIDAWLDPEVDLVSGAIVGAEALARWRSDGLSVAGPFVNASHRSGLREALVIELLDQVWAWRDRASWNVPIGIDVATAHLPAVLRRHDDDPRGRPLVGLRFEISETDVIRDFDRTSALLHACRERGAEVMLDDFGSSHSSLRTLSDLPIDGFKIDRSYVARLHTDHRVRRLVSGLAEFGRNCDMRVVAEGVETPEQAEFLLAVGIDRGQGSLYSTALSPQHFDGLIADGCQPAPVAGRF